MAIAPWFSIDCTQAYINAAALGPVQALIFYKPNNSTNKPQDADSPVWSLGDNGAWRKNSRLPIFAIPGLDGQKIMTQLSLYSGTPEQVPHGNEIEQLYKTHPPTYLRVFTVLHVDLPSSPPRVWAFVLIAIGAVLLVISVVSLTMHFVQRRNRKTLKRRVESGEVDLEAMGIKRVTVPASHVMKFPIFTYNAEPDSLDMPSSPRTQSTQQRGAKKARKKRRKGQESVAKSDTVAQSTPSVRSIRSKRSNITGMADTTATNYQPECLICLASFDHHVTIIRELPCGHIFHTECIDEFLIHNSSLCPTCKHSMLPRGYSPRITNGMVRRERALRRLRERVDFDDLSLESGDARLKGWKWFISAVHSKRTSSRSSSDQPMKRIGASKGSMGDRDPTDSNTTHSGSPERPADIESQDTTNSTSNPAPALAPKTKPKKSKPKGLRLLPTQPENAELNTSTTTGPNRRGSPSSFARERMRQIADNNAPFDDPDHQRPKCK